MGENLELLQFKKNEQTNKEKSTKFGKKIANNVLKWGNWRKNVKKWPKPSKWTKKGEKYQFFFVEKMAENSRQIFFED